MIMIKLSMTTRHSHVSVVCPVVRLDDSPAVPIIVPGRTGGIRPAAWGKNNGGEGGKYERGG